MAQAHVRQRRRDATATEDQGTEEEQEEEEEDDDYLAIAVRSLHLSAHNIALARAAVRAQHSSLLSTLITHKKMLPHSLTNQQLTSLFAQFSSLDSNNWSHNVGAGEREARIYCSLVASRHFYLAHGVGRSGNLNVEQPKATGSSMLARLTEALTLDAVRLAGLDSAARCLISPVPTGATLTLVLAACKAKLAANASTAAPSASPSASSSSSASPAPSAIPAPAPRFVLMPRIDQRTCVKCVASANLTLISVANKLNGDALETDVDALQACIEREGAHNFVALISVASCFAPRSGDDVEACARLCLRYGIPHLINNAYGLQSRSLLSRINRATRVGRVDAIISSCDKNFMVPVAGAIVITPHAMVSSSSPHTSSTVPSSSAALPTPISSFGVDFIDDIARMWSGRASISHVIDLFATLLSMGRDGWLKLLHDRQALFVRLQGMLTTLAIKHHTRMLAVPLNEIGLALALPESAASKRDISLLGSMLFARGVSGCRAVSRHEEWGPHASGYPHSYLAMACSIGMTQADCDELIKRLDRTLAQWKKKIANA